MKPTWENSSIYLQNHNTFYRWILYPIILLILFIGFFLAFAKKEVVIRTTAQLTANTSKLEIPLDLKIIENNLKENKNVKKDEILIVLDNKDFILQKETLEKENAQINEEKIAAMCFIESLNTDSNHFTTSDSFGYENQLKSIFAENTANELTMDQKNLEYQKALETYQKIKEQLENQKITKENQVSDWTQIRTAWENQQSLDGFSTEIMTEYQSWQTQLTETTEDQKKQIKLTISTTINDRITQIKNEIDQIKSEQVKLVSPVEIEDELNSLKAIYIQKKESAITSAKQKIKELNINETKNSDSIKSLNQQINQLTIKAPVDGKIHLNEEVSGLSEIPKGTVIAEIYPYANKQQQPFTAYISASEMTHITKNMPIHLNLDKKGIASEVLNGQLSEIAETSTTTEKGNFYLIKGVINVPTEVNIRYGLSGELSLVLGKKTYLQIIKEWIFNE